MLTVEDGQRNDQMVGELDGLLEIAAQREVAEVYVWSVSARTFQRLHPASGSSTDKSLSGPQ